MKEIWDERYSSKDYVYGIEPNEFFKNALDTYRPQGKILMPAEGEGRNAVYAAKKGLDVTAFDISNEGKNKALKLATKERVSLRYEVGDFFDLPFINEQFDAVSLIFAHFPPPLLSTYHSKISELIKPDGMIFLEGFSTSHLEYQQEYPHIGGPKNVEFLFSTESIREDFPNFEIIQLEEVEVELHEGKFHVGRGSVIRFVGKKIDTVL